jgi:hypothetical protein
VKKLALFFVLLLLVSALWAQNRYALVIGNADYPGQREKLPNTKNDTEAIYKVLKDELGYDATLRNDLNQRAMIREIDAFIARLKANRNSEGFFWYAGHAMEIAGENFLLPIDVDTESENLIKNTSLSVDQLTKQLSGVGNKVNVLVLDACRVPPGVGGDSRAIGDPSRAIKTVPIVAPDLFIIYSTASGTTASDGPANGNSPFAQAFLKNIRSTEPLQLMMGHVTTDTLALTGQRQRPYTSGSMGSENIYYSLNQSGSSPVQPNPAPSQTPSNQPSPQSSVAVGSITVTSAIAGEILIDGHSTGTRIKSGGAVSITNVSAGYTEVAVKEDDGTITKTPNLIMVRQGQTVTATIERPVSSSTVTSPPQTSNTPVSLEEALKRASQFMIQNIPANATVAILSIETPDAEVAEFAIGELTYQIILSKKYRVVDRKIIDTVAREQHFQISGTIDDNTAISISKLLGASVVITGSTSGTGSARRLRVMALDVKTGEILAMASEQF